MSKILVVAQHDGQNMNVSTARAVRCAAEIGDEIDVLVLAESGQAVAEQIAKLNGVKKVVHVDNDANSHSLAVILAPQIAEFAKSGSYTHVLGPNTTYGKDLMPTVAALLDVAMVTDIMAVHGERSFDRPIYAGNAVITVEVDGDNVIVGSVRCASYTAAEEGGSASIESVSVDVELPKHTRFVGMEEQGGEGPDLQSAPKVVSGGRGVGSKENFDIMYNLGKKLNAAVGASRAAVDSGFCPNDMQVGQTGKIIAPELYMAFGISGAIQHLAGIKDAGCIVAVNKDEEAPIFEIADFGLVGDLFEVIPEMESKL